MAHPRAIAESLRGLQELGDRLAVPLEADHVPLGPGQGPQCLGQRVVITGGAGELDGLDRQPVGLVARSEDQRVGHPRGDRGPQRDLLVGQPGEPLPHDLQGHGVGGSGELGHQSLVRDTRPGQ